MRDVVELSIEMHGDCRVAEGSALRFAAGQHIMQIHAAEIRQAACVFPVFFSPSPGTGGWTLTVALSLESGRNLFIEDGQWTAAFLPAGMQTYPLFLMKLGAHEPGYTVGVIGHDGVLSQDRGEALFDKHGKPSMYLNNVTKLLEAGVESEAQTRLFAQRLEGLGLMKSVSISVEYEDGAVQSISGLCMIDEDKLRALPVEELEALNKDGYLLLMHAMLVSVFQINTLIRKNNQAAGGRPIKQAKLEPAGDAAATDPAS